MMLLSVATSFSRPVQVHPEDVRGCTTALHDQLIRVLIQENKLHDSCQIAGVWRSAGKPRRRRYEEQQAKWDGALPSPKTIR